MSDARAIDPATRPPAAAAEPASSPCDARIRYRDLAPLNTANGARIPNGRASTPRTSARVAPRSLMCRGRSPEAAAAQDEVEDGADAPEEGDHNPQDLLQARQVRAADDVDHAQHESHRMQKDRKQHLDDYFQDHSLTIAAGRTGAAAAIRGQPPAGANVPSGACS